MKLPKEGDFITIQSYKHDGSLHRTWRDTMVLKTTENAVIGVNAVSYTHLDVYKRQSIPSATTASAPSFSIRLASATDGITGITVIPASWKRSIYLPGFPAPVVTTLTPSSIRCV